MSQNQMSQTDQNKSKPFYTWKANGIEFLAIWNGSGYHITDETAQNFGAWQTLENFRRLQKAHDPNGFLGIPGSWCLLRMAAVDQNPGYASEPKAPPCAGISAAPRFP